MSKTAVAAALIVFMLVGVATAANIEVAVTATASDSMISQMNMVGNSVQDYESWPADEWNDAQTGVLVNTQSYDSNVMGIGGITVTQYADNKGNMKVTRGIYLNSPGSVYADESMGVNAYSPLDENCNLCYGDRFNAMSALVVASSRLVMNNGYFYSRSTGDLAYDYTGVGHGYVYTGINGYTKAGVVDCYYNSLNPTGGTELHAKYIVSGDFSTSGSMKYAVF